jgi:multicomponent Na+:H+ antiporter subunit C
VTVAVAVAVAVVAGGAFLLTRAGVLRLVLGFVLLGHAVNLVLLAAGGTSRREPALLGPDLAVEATADPLPQAFVLTAIVITFGVTVFLLGLIARDDADTGGGDQDAG